MNRCLKRCTWQKRAKGCSWRSAHRHYTSINLYVLEVSELTMQPLVGPGGRRREAKTSPEARPFLAAAAKFTIYAFDDIDRRASRRRESPLYQMNVGGKGGEKERVK